MSDFEFGPVTRVPDNVPTEPVCDPARFEPLRFTLELAPGALAMAPDGFNWVLGMELAALKKDAMRAYYDARE